ncbi:MAG: type II secretion system F family protein [Acidobacteria bacterium]|nr:type II secretion system F family protein [Acidobacteriota bacterium]MCB9398915.1 type II secretion system F family protein [Acidobacteriota bacterium]
MSVFYYKATNSQGKMETGQVEVASKQAAVQWLEKKGLFPILVSDVQQRTQISLTEIDLSNYLPSRRVGMNQVLDFTDKLSSLLKAGLPLARALTLLIETTQHEPMRDVVRQILKDVSAGKSLADSLAAHPKVFERLYINMVRTGEAAGVLEHVLINLRDFIQTRQNLKSFLMSSLMYPAILLFTAMGTVAVLVFFVLPKFQDIFNQLGQDMPFITQLMVDTTRFFSDWKWVIGFLVVSLLIGFIYWKNSPEGSRKWDLWLLRAPMLGKILTEVEVTRFSNSLGILLKSSVSLLDAMHIVKDLSENKVFQAAMDPVIKGIKKGEGMSYAMVQSGVFPKMAVHLVTVGEETGTLGEMFEKISKIYQANLEKTLKRFIAVFEPIMILVMFVVVGFIIAAMLMAVTSISQINM